jgi:hypothetical protein
VFWILLQQAAPTAEHGRFFWDHDLSAHWQWATVMLAVGGIFIGLVAILMAAPPIFQMIWGAPKIAISVGKADSEMKALIFNVSNKPVKSWVLRKMGVRRQSTEVVGSLWITQEHKGEIVAHGIPDLFAVDGLAPKRRAIGSSIAPGAHIPVIWMDKGRAWAQAEANSPNVTLPPDIYLASVKLESGEDMLSYSHHFVVTPDEIYWASLA